MENVIINDRFVSFTKELQSFIADAVHNGMHWKVLKTHESGWFLSWRDDGFPKGADGQSALKFSEYQKEKIKT